MDQRRVMAALEIRVDIDFQPTSVLDS